MRLVTLFFPAVCLLIVPSVVCGQQISPNPNPAGNTITVDTMDWYNWGDDNDQFSNSGTININNGSRLENKADITNWATLTNERTGVISIAAGGTLDNDISFSSLAVLDKFPFLH